MRFKCTQTDDAQEKEIF